MGQESYEQLVARGVELGEQRDFGKAIRALQQAIELDDERVDAHYDLGVIYGLLAMSDLAVEELFEDHVDEEILLQNAIDQYQRALELDPGHVAAHNNLATLYALHGERELAVRELEASLQIDPDQPDAREQLGELRGS